MARFCTQCGVQNADDAAFCESCGKSLERPNPVAPVVDGSRRLNPWLLWGSLGTAALLIVALGLLVWLARPPAGDARPAQNEALRAYLLAQPAASEALVCLGNLPYQLEEFRVRPLDQATNDWLGVLVEAGLYLPPRDEQVERGNLLEEQKIYARTAAGSQLIRGNRLCFAEGIELVRIDAATPPRELKNGDASATARFFYRYRNPQAWVANPRLKEIMPARFSQNEWPAGAILQRRNQQWSVERLVDASVAEQALRRESATPGKAPAAEGWQDWWRKLFATAPNQLLGSWRADLGGLGNLAAMAGVLGGVAGQEQLLLTLEFGPKSMRMLGQEIPVSYEVRGSEILVRAEKSGSALPGGGDVLSFKIQDNEHVSLDLAVIEIPYTRSR